MENDQQIGQWVAGSAAGVSSALSAGYVIWIIRGSYLVSSVLAQMPAWSFVDPLVVLQYLDEESPKRDDEDDEQSESEKNVEHIFEGATA